LAIEECSNKNPLYYFTKNVVLNSNSISKLDLIEKKLMYSKEKSRFKLKFNIKSQFLKFLFV
jgi:hypothetical protein